MDQEIKMVDINAPKAVEISVSKENVIHINVDGVCRLRIQRCPYITIEWRGECIAEYKSME